MLGRLDLNLKPKLVILFVMTGLVPLVAAGYFGSVMAIDALMEKSFSQLLAVQAIRTGQLESAYQQRANDLSLLAGSREIQVFTQRLIDHRDQAQRAPLTAPDAYERMVAAHAPALERFIASYGCRDLKIIDTAQHQIMYAHEKDAPLWQNLSMTRYAASGLARAFRTVMDTGTGTIIDFEPFEPAGGVETAFLAQPVWGTHGKVVAVLIIQVTPEFISRIMESRKGMGKTGESYILDYAVPDRRFELRSDLKTMGNGEYVIGFALDRNLAYWEEAVKKGLQGGSGTYVDSAGNAVLAAYNRLNIPGLNWYLISKIDKYEVEAPVRHILLRSFYLSLFLAAVIGMGSFFFSRRFARPIIEDMRFAQAIAQGRLDQQLKINRGDELGKLARALNHMAKTLYDMDWLKKGKEGLNDSLRGEESVGELGKRFISFVVRHLDAQLGAFYKNEGDVLKLVATYAFTDRHGNFNAIPVGQGMVGQAALEQKLIIFNEAPDDEAPVIHHGTGERKAAAYMIVPLVFEHRLMGVFVVGAVHRFTPLQKRFIKEVAPNVAVLLNAAKSRATIETLLEQAKSQNTALKASESELQAQQEELRVANEELEEQTKALKASEEELQAQQEELRVTNEELETHAKSMEEQKEAMVKKNDDLVQARQELQKKAEELEIASKYKSEFLANMSHELRTPLNSILILSQLLSANKEKNLSDKQTESAQAIHSSGEDLLTLINEILDLSKVEAGKVELAPEEVVLKDLASDLNRTFKEQAGNKGIFFDIDLKADELPMVIQTDPLRLTQILRNLLTNAFKFTAKGTVTLTIARPAPALVEGSSLPAASSVAMAVKDQGIGIPKEQQAAVFEAFRQADGSTSRKYGGTGLGLSISRELSRLLGGFIHLESEPDKGSTFTIVIPERIGARPSAAAPAPPISKPVEKAVEAGPQKNPPPQLTGDTVPDPAPFTDPAPFIKDDRKHLDSQDKSLLIIEDDPGSARIMRDFSRERGFRCIIAEDGETGLHFADYYRPSAIILDIGLPGIDGWTVLERLKKNPDLRHIPVHFMSAADSTMDAMRMGAVGFLTKPVTLEKVDETFEKIERIITRPVRRLLVVEDDTRQQQSIRELIGSGDVETVMAASGAKALEALASERFDCMILDLGLGDMSGFELLEQIRTDPDKAGVPVIVYTGRDLTREENKQLEHYADSIIIKGVKSPERLLEESALFLHRVESDLPRQQQHMMKTTHDPASVLKDKTVLLVDDDMRNVFALSAVLEQKQMNIRIARNGVEGVEKARAHNDIDLILMDIMMPKMDGYEAMGEIRKTHRDLPIIALTAKAMKGDRNKCIEAGASDYLAKPVDTDKLISMLRVWLYK